jgi:hypothetical protein
MIKPTVNNLQIGWSSWNNKLSILHFISFHCHTTIQLESGRPLLFFQTPPPAQSDFLSSVKAEALIAS